MSVELAEVKQFLADHAPFSSLPENVLDELPAKAQAKYYRRGSRILSAGDEVEKMWLIRSGVVEVVDIGGNIFDYADVGRSFGQSAIIEDRRSRFSFTAVEDTLVLIFPADVVNKLVDDFPFVREYYDRRRLSSIGPKLSITESAPVFTVSVKEMMANKKPIFADQSLNVQQAAQKMQKAGVSSLMVTDNKKLVGIITDRDLRRVVSEAIPPETKITEVMTSDPEWIRADALAIEVLMQFALHNIHHLPVMLNNRPVGMVSSGDLIRLEQFSPLYLVKDLMKQTTIDDLVSVTAKIPDVVLHLLDLDASAEDVSRIISLITQSLTQKLLAMGIKKFGEPPVPYCWVALGSLARQEQALISDQDHAMILANSYKTEYEPYFSKLAAYVTDCLEKCNFSLCKGNVMSTNPEWRKSVAMWQQDLRVFFGTSQTDEILQAAIALDMRPIYGDPSLFEEVQNTVMEVVPKSNRFLMRLAQHVTSQKPPLGFLRGFVVEREGDHRDRLNMKQGAINSIVEIARLYALSHGIPTVTTRGRIRDLYQAGVLTDETSRNLLAGYEFMCYQRLASQADQAKKGIPIDNYIDPKTLSEFDKRQLRSTFHIVSTAQQRMQVMFQTQMI